MGLLDKEEAEEFRRLALERVLWLERAGNENLDYMIRLLELAAEMIPLRERVDLQNFNPVMDQLRLDPSSTNPSNFKGNVETHLERLVLRMLLMDDGLTARLRDALADIEVTRNDIAAAWEEVQRTARDFNSIVAAKTPGAIADSFTKVRTRNNWIGGAWFLAGLGAVLAVLLFALAGATTSEDLLTGDATAGDVIADLGPIGPFIALAWTANRRSMHHRRLAVEAQDAALRIASARPYSADWGAPEKQREFLERIGETILTDRVLRGEPRRE